MQGTAAWTPLVASSLSAPAFARVSSSGSRRVVSHRGLKLAELDPADEEVKADMHERIVGRPARGDWVGNVAVQKQGKGIVRPRVFGGQRGNLRLWALGGLALMTAAGFAGIADADAVSFPDVFGERDRVRAEGGQLFRSWRAGRRRR